VRQLSQKLSLGGVLHPDTMGARHIEYEEPNSRFSEVGGQGQSGILGMAVVGGI